MTELLRNINGTVHTPVINCFFTYEDTKMRITTRSEAFEDGRNTYFTGRACKNGHVAERYVRNGSCMECIRCTARSYRNGFSQSRIYKTRGYRLINVWVHPDDEPGLLAHVEALKDARMLMEPAHTRGLPPGYHHGDGAALRNRSRR
jgi:hypothetical protein